MQTKQISLVESQDQTSKGSYIAEVVSVERGEATLVYIDALEKEVPIIAHSSGVPVLYPCDRVILQEFPQGFVITDRLRGKNEKPTQGFVVDDKGMLRIKNSEGFHMATENGSIEIRKDGRIYLQGNEIYSVAEGLLLLQGSLIKAN